MVSASIGWRVERFKGVTEEFARGLKEKHTCKTHKWHIFEIMPIMVFGLSIKVGV